jgi:HAD superfamily hydrolase (TIGR01450 family)
VFVTNNSGPTVSEYVGRLGRAGVDIDAGELLTSSQAAASLLEPGSRAAVVGDPGIKEALDDRGVAIVAVADHPDAVVVGRSINLDFAELAAAATAIRAGARFVATNNDATFPTPHGLEPGAGAVVAYLEVGSGRTAEVAGKPHQPAADLLRARFGSPGLVVGDRPDTDGLFAQLVGAPYALVLSGVTRAEDLPVSPKPALVEPDLASVVAARLGP